MSEREHAADTATVSAAEFAIVVDDPVARCARPAPNPRLRAAIIAADVIIDRPTARAPSSPRTGNHEKGIGDGGSSSSSRSVGIAPPSLARAREGREYGQRGSQRGFRSGVLAPSTP
jgi:hypothetical protein